MDLHRGAQTKGPLAKMIKESGCDKKSQKESERVRMFIVIFSNCYIFANVKREVPTPKAFFDIFAYNIPHPLHL